MNEDLNKGKTISISGPYVCEIHGPMFQAFVIQTEESRGAYCLDCLNTLLSNKLTNELTNKQTNNRSDLVKGDDNACYYPS